MTIVLGFGSTEKEVEQQIKSELAEYGLEVTQKKWNDQSEINGKLPRDKAPERYTRFYYYDNTITFHHINRQHPFSPDGWGMLEVKEPFGVAQLKKGLDNG